MARIGQLNQLIDIQEDTGTVNSVGQKIPSWTLLTTVWSHVRAVGGGETITSKLELATTDYLVIIRYRTDITTLHRVVLENGTILDIQRVADLDGRKRELQLKCLERKPS